MYEQGSPIRNQLAVIMVAAGTQDERAIALVQAMRQAGLRVTFAETAHIAARASEAAACVVVLRPDTWKSQAIATVMRTKPDCLIPVLAEEMELPRGPWTHPAIALADEVEQNEQQLIQTLRDYLDTHPQGEPAQLTSADVLTINKPLKFKKRRRRVNPGPLLTTILLLVILALGGLLGYRYYTSHPSNTKAAITSSNNLNTVAPHIVYNAATPGQYCDGGSGQWGLGDRYVKTVDKKKTEVIDKYTTLQCQSGGTLLTRSGDYKDSSSELFFDGIDAYSSIAQHYLAQVDATIMSGDAQADVAMDVHIHNNGYGRDSFDVNTLGHWAANTGSTIDGSSINRLAIGFLPKGAKTYTLKVEANGPVMAFWINDTLVTTVTDTTYPDNSAIGFSIGDWSASSPISALFSNFKYKELTPSALATPAVVATATAQTQANLQTSYSAHIPGYGCDTGAGQWQPLADTNDLGTLNCLSNGMQLISPANARTVTSEDFYWLNGRFPQNYKVSAQVDVGYTANVCAGLALREDNNGNHYTFTICADGSWEIDYSGNSNHTLAQGNVRGQSTYTITAQANGSALSLSLNNQLLKTVNDTHLTNTDHLSLLTGYYQSSQNQSVTFSNFTFTPLP